MKYLEQVQIKVAKFFSRALSAIITNVNFLLMLGKIAINVGFVIIAVGILGVLCVGLAATTNLLRGTNYSGAKILKDLMTSLWKKSLNESSKKWKSHQNS